MVPNLLKTRGQQNEVLHKCSTWGWGCSDISLIILAGVLLGDPYGDNIFVEHPTITRNDVRALEALSKGDQKLALAMVDLFFSKDVQAASLVTRKEDRNLLDQNIIEGIRCK